MVLMEHDPLKQALEPLLAHPPAQPRPLEDIVAGARHRRTRRKVAAGMGIVLAFGMSAAGLVAGQQHYIDSDPARSFDGTDPTVDPTPSEAGHTSIIQDTDVGDTPGTVEFTGDSWTRCRGCDVATDDGSYSYGYSEGQSYTVRFEGVRIRVFAPDDRHGGLAQVTLDGAAAEPPTVDFLTSGQPANKLIWDSGVLEDGEHAVTFTIEPVQDGRDATVALFDHAEVETAEGGTGVADDEAGDGADDEAVTEEADAAAAAEPAESATAEPATAAAPEQATQAGAAPGYLGVATYDPYEFESWLGRSVDVWETWNGYTWPEMLNVSGLHTYMTGEGAAPFNRRWEGKASIGQPMWSKGESAQTCNSGANDDNMRTVAQNIADAGFPDAYIRLGWEMNGYWFGDTQGAWQDTEGWITCWRRWHGILKGVSPDFKLVWNPNWNSNTGGGAFDVRTAWPGDEYVDAAGPDIYDWNLDPAATSDTGEPNGIDAWIDFVVNEHNTPFAMPEWGLNVRDGGGDNPEFIQTITSRLSDLKAQGMLEYASYFNLDGCNFQIQGDGCNPQSGEAYRSWAQGV